MESDGFDQVQYIEKMGFCTNWGQNMLHQVCAEGRSGADAWSCRRSAGVYLDAILEVRTNAYTRYQRPEQNETSISLVPRNHPLIPPPSLEPEASGLLDRLLNVFSEENRYLCHHCTCKELSLILWW